MSKEIAKTLIQLAAEINKFDALCQRTMQTTLENAMKTGDLLVQAKTQVPHGEWEAWIEANTTMSARTAQKYMRLASGREEISKSAQGALLTIRKAVDLIADKDEETEEDNLPEEAPVEPVEDSDGVASSESSPTGQSPVDQAEQGEDTEEEEIVVDPMREFNLEVKRWATSVTKMIEDLPENAWFDETFVGSIKDTLKAAAGAARSVVGHGECPACSGTGCETCRFTGWLPKRQFDEASA